MPDQLTTIKNSAFANNQFTSITFPPTLNSLGNYALNVTTLTHVEFLGTVPSVGVGVFPYNGANTIKVPSGTLEQYKSVSHSSYSPSKIWFGQDDDNLLDAFYE